MTPSRAIASNAPFSIARTFLGDLSALANTKSAAINSRESASRYRFTIARPIDEDASAAESPTLSRSVVELEANLLDWSVSCGGFIILALRSIVILWLRWFCSVTQAT
jgi:hypothetical protein